LLQQDDELYSHLKLTFPDISHCVRCIFGLSSLLDTKSATSSTCHSTLQTVRRAL